MKKENKIILVIIISALLISTSIFLGFYILKQQTTGKIIDNEYSKLSSKPSDNNLIGKHVVTKIIDGDTIVVEGENLRLLGMDADERGYPCYTIAKKRLEELILNKEVELEKDQTNKDQYERYLRYIFLNKENINLRLVEEGLAVARFYPEDIKYKNEIIDAETRARNNKLGCKWAGGEQTKPSEKIPDSIETSDSISSTNNEGSIDSIDKEDWKELTSENTGLDIVGVCNAGNHIDEGKIVEGKIVDTYRSKTNTIFLNFEKPYPNHCFVAVIFSSDIYKFPENPEDYYDGKIVRISGEIKEYEGKPEIILNNMGQVEVR